MIVQYTQCNKCIYYYSAYTYKSVSGKYDVNQDVTRFCVPDQILNDLLHSYKYNNNNEFDIILSCGNNRGIIVVV